MAMHPNTAKKMATKISNSVSTMSPTELRLTANAAQAELTARRTAWVRANNERFQELERSGRAVVNEVSDPTDYWRNDRVVVTVLGKSRINASVGMARVAPGDRYDYSIGIAIAFARAMGEEVPDLF